MKKIAHHELGQTTIIYYENPQGGCEWVLVPSEKVDHVELPQRLKFDSLIQVKLVGDGFPKGFVTGSTMRNSETVRKLTFDSQTVKVTLDGMVRINTFLQDQQGNVYEHILRRHCDANVFETFVRFENQTEMN